MPASVVGTTTDPEPRATRSLLRWGCLLLGLELLLGVAHLLWPEYRWGQGRRSYFNLDNSLTLASWLASMQLAGVAVLSLAAFHRERWRLRAGPAVGSVWILCALLALGLSFAEITRIHTRLELGGLPDPDIYQQLVIHSLWLGLLVVVGWLLLDKLSSDAPARRLGVGWLLAWGLHFALSIVGDVFPSVRDHFDSVLSLLIGLAYLLGCTLLLLAIGGYVLRARFPSRETVSGALAEPRADPFVTGRSRVRLWLGVGGATFIVISLQIILFRILTIVGDYLTASSIISIALLGIAVGGYIGALTAARVPVPALVGASLLLPPCILGALGAVVELIDNPLSLSIFLMLPFAAASTAICIVLARSQSHVVYFVDLVGAALGALALNGALLAFREEGSVLVLGGIGCLVVACFAGSIPSPRLRRGLTFVALCSAVAFFTLGARNSDHEWLNVVRTKVLNRYAQAEVLFSRSSLVGRYDVVRRQPRHKTLATYDNGRIIDNMRRRPADQYRIDPRLPHTLMAQPSVLILGLSGDGISKTAKYLGKRVVGVEINPVIVELQTNELVEFNANSYEGIDVAVMDGRSFAEQSREQFDIIALMNAHIARGRTAGRAPSPEYLHTLEAIDTYLSRLTDRGMLIVEEPVSRIRREVPVWKLVATMREALKRRGVTEPERHFFIFQWKTKRNNYIQIVMKKQALTGADIVKLRRWLQDVDEIRAIEARLGRRMGPIRSKTTLLHSPDESLETNVARILRGEADADFVQARNLQPTIDDRPFHFDVDPHHPNVKAAYRRTLLITIFLLPFLLAFLRRDRRGMRSALPYVFVVALTGTGYLLVEVVLLQRLAIFLGSPVVTFSTVLGTLLFFSGLGSLWSGRLGRRGLYASMAAIAALLAFHQWGLADLLAYATAWPAAAKVSFTVLAIAPLAFFMGVPFPFVLRTGKQRFTASAAALLFAINAAASALAVPLTLDLSMSHGFQATFAVGIVLYLVVAVVLAAMHEPRLQIPVNVLAAATVLALALSPWLVGGRADAEPGRAVYRVYALSYGHSAYREDKIVLGGSSRSRLRFEWLFWLVRGNGRTILVDTGFSDLKAVRRWGLRRFVSPTARLRTLGLAPEDVTDIILTHAHWDHVGDLRLYRNATVWIQDTEYQHAAAHVSADRPRSRGMRWSDLRALRSAESEGRLRRVDGERQIAPGVTVTLGGAHTPGFQYASVDAIDGRIIIAGDATYLYINNQWHRPIGAAVDHAANLEAIRDMQRRAASPFFILPGHDPLVMRHFPRITDGVVEITAVEASR